MGPRRDSKRFHPRRKVDQGRQKELGAPVSPSASASVTLASKPMATELMGAPG